MQCEAELYRKKMARVAVAADIWDCLLADLEEQMLRLLRGKKRHQKRSSIMLCSPL